MPKNKTKSRTMKKGIMRPPGQGKSRKAKARARARGLGSGRDSWEKVDYASLRAANPRWGFKSGAAKIAGWDIPTIQFGSDVRSRGCTSPRGLAEAMAIGTPSINPQAVTPYWRTGVDKQGNRVDVLCGTESLSSVQTDDVGAQAGDILFSLPLNPTEFLDTRVKQFAPLYQRYRFRKLNIIYGAIANRTLSGQVIGFSDYDVDNMLSTDTPLNVNQAAAHVGQRVNQIFEHAMYPFRIRDEFTTLFTSLTEAEARLIYQGVFYLIASSNIAANLELGRIFLDYEIEFAINQLAVAGLDPVILQSALKTSGITVTESGPGDPGVEVLPMGLGVAVHNAAFPVDTLVVNPQVDGSFTTSLPTGKYLVYSSIDALQVSPSAPISGLISHKVVITPISGGTLNAYRVDDSIAYSGATSWTAPIAGASILVDNLMFCQVLDILQSGEANVLITLVPFVTFIGSSGTLTVSNDPSDYVASLGVVALQTSARNALGRASKHAPTVRSTATALRSLRSDMAVMSLHDREQHHAPESNLRKHRVVSRLLKEKI